MDTDLVDPTLEKKAAESLLEPPIKAELISQHQHSPAAQLTAQDAGKLAIGYHTDMSDQAPKASLTAPVWNWTVHNKSTNQAVCPGTWSVGGKITISPHYKYWMGSFRDGTVALAPLNTAALANHPRSEQIQKLYDDEVAAFKAGQKSLETIFNGPIRDNEGTTRARCASLVSRRSARCTTSAASGSSRTSSVRRRLRRPAQSRRCKQDLVILARAVATWGEIKWPG